MPTRSKSEPSRQQAGRNLNPSTTHEMDKRNTREAAESKEARNAEASNRDRMIDVGRGNQQAGRQGQ